MTKLFLLKNSVLLTLLFYCHIVSAEVEDRSKYDVTDTPSYINNYVNNAQLVGQGRMKVMLWQVYDAKLYSPSQQWQKNVPFALSLEYLRKLNGQAIAERTIKEIRGQGFNNKQVLDQWLLTLIQIFPDVDKTSKITGIRDENKNTVFFHNGRYLATISDPLFTELFFGIWLDEKTSSPELRSQLLNGAS